VSINFFNYEVFFISVIVRGTCYSAEQFNACCEWAKINITARTALEHCSVTQLTWTMQQ